MKKTKILLIFGGESTEHEVSIMSAKNVNQGVDREKFDVRLAYINKQGHWFATEEVAQTDQSPMKIDLVGRAFLIGEVTYRPDVLLPVLHGQNGEDGMIAALGQLLGMHVVGSDMTASAVSMDKLLSKQIAQWYDVPVAPYVAVRAYDNKPKFAQLASDLGEVIFVKPTRAGSSVGVSKVTDQASFEVALELAFQHDDTVLVEKAMIGRELEVAVLGKGADLSISPVGEILVSEEDEFYSYEAKYSDNSKTTTTVSAKLDPETEAKVQAMAEAVYRGLRCAGLARVDFFLVDGQPYFNEINTLPGFTNISMYPKMMENGGISQKDLITKLIEIA